jgi:hypothetical protein
MVWDERSITAGNEVFKTSINVFRLDIKSNILISFLTLN